MAMEAKNYRGNPNYNSFVLHLADTNLILAQRLCEWCGHGPILEQDIALSNIALDLLGQAHNYYDYAASLIGNDQTADTLAMLRSEKEYKNLLLVELPNGDFGRTVVRQFFFDSFSILFLKQLLKVGDPGLRGIVEKSLMETKYHLRWSSEWMIRLGDGTEESHQRMKGALDFVLPFIGEMFVLTEYHKELIDAGLVPDPRDFREEWEANIQEIFDEATLQINLQDCHTQKGGKEGIHTEYFGYILTELQYIQRAYPGLEW